MISIYVIQKAIIKIYTLFFIIKKSILHRKKLMQKTIQEQDQRVFQIIKNNIQETKIQTLRDLVHLKNLYASLMPKMQKEYFVKLLFDTYHQSLVIKNNNKIFAGVTFRGFQDRNFYQIAFFAVNHQNQLKGYGKIIMNKLKKLCQQREIKYLIAYADNQAVGFFRKNGFNSKLTLPQKQYKKYLKQYVGGCFMQCYINEDIDYERFQKKIKKLQEIILSKALGLAHNSVQYELQNSSKLIKQKANEIKNVKDLVQLIPGLKQAGYESLDSSNNLINIDFLILCQYFLQMVIKKSHLLEQSKLKREQSQQQNINYDYNRQQKFISLVQYMQKKLINGIYLTKKQFMDDFERGLQMIIDVECKTSSSREKQFRKRVQDLVNDFYRNQLYENFNGKKYKIEEYNKDIQI